jgi:HKD family nuclease
MKKIKAKFKCDSVTDFGDQKRADLSAVTSGSEENKSFAKFTPSGNLSISIDSETEASNLFQPGKEYLLEFSESEN